MTQDNKPKNYSASPEIISGFSPWLTPLSYFITSKILLPFYFQIEVRGQEKIPIDEEAIILAPTHRSRWDPLVIAYTVSLVTKRYLRYMVSQEQVEGFQGWFIRRLGGFPIDRESPGISALRHSVKILKNQEILVLFPEGKIYPEDNEIHFIQPGVSRIALQVISSRAELNLKIVPISILYDHPAPPPWRCGVQVNIGSPLVVKDYLGDSTKQASQELTTNIELSLKQLHKKSF
ncbi:MAG: 1-acyl-sn-glycerol-3-phosphate acyltransferase [Trichodesmium sp. St16_bin4-tuft]|uniref:Phospholipid/glycerol acyltransferase n=1 Tax=Trichodesmium erythraeum (strain IMS101) TaxID=203124 RepID=Q111N0_TRIEI|nr:1-acyl-sn-glycerol-3-phosphate acyltransferase [Trichodesmium erythraeum GBRTRLIN201]MCH2047641.1 1-acyl-sn-glycerol-3-phosphate acyltransferase [Trichodesmium sp. ALOHA_ZT_67]MCL2926736.1 1-acyl-sn-glycerol-3-phosphate acyltransferase [Trichodesmium sp. MAG_R01]MDE5074105.1 1-acyl-sn-glycerol-3-phosphate acyltransferase [Trichodesmium sp. St5_bin8]MDE5091174.1 1-acyl-sn-glycerol-3-phosphate acyltransferase [Trichodesmium sp. St18_bin3_1_1]MDE5094355.1 1-acyl-sn-glycerol-3-phosphate acyltra